MKSLNVLRTLRGLLLTTAALGSFPALGQVSPSVQVHILSATQSPSIYVPETRYCVAREVQTQGRQLDLQFKESEVSCQERASVLSPAEVEVLRAERAGPRD